MLIDFLDTSGVQVVPLVRAPGSNIETDFVKLVIEEVYAGSWYDDTCLAEIEVWGITKQPAPVCSCGLDQREPDLKLETQAGLCFRKAIPLIYVVRPVLQIGQSVLHGTI